MEVLLLLLAFIVLFTPVGVTNAMGALLVIPAILWTPGAALVTARLARSQGLDVRRHAVVGAWFSALLLVPWVLLLNAMRQGTASHREVRPAYISQHVVWLLGPIIYWGQVVSEFRALSFGMLDDPWGSGVWETRTYPSRYWSATATPADSGSGAVTS